MSVLVAGGSGGAGAQEPLVDITEVTFDRFGTIVGTGTPYIAVWITCDGTGMISDLGVTLEQRDIAAGTNLDLMDAPCTTTPTRYTVQMDVFDLVFEFGKVRVVRATESSSGENFATGQTIILRPKPLE